MLIYVIFYALSFFAIAVISREWLLCVVAIPLLTGFVILTRSEFVSGGELFPIFATLWVGVIAGTAGRATTMLFATKNATIPIGVALASGPVLFMLFVAALMQGV